MTTKRFRRQSEQDAYRLLHTEGLELDFSATLTSKGQPCMVMRYNVAPIRNYHRLQ